MRPLNGRGFRKLVTSGVPSIVCSCPQTALELKDIPFQVAHAKLRDKNAFRVSFFMDDRFMDYTGPRTYLDIREAAIRFFTDPVTASLDRKVAEKAQALSPDLHFFMTPTTREEP